MIPTRRAPLVSIVMPTYNQERYIESAIKSIQAQTFADWELVIINDGSTDNTDVLVVSRFADPRIQLYHRPHGEDYGISALNHGMERVTGRYLTWVSSDNIYLRTFLRSLAEVLDATEADFAYGDFMNLHEDGKLEEVARPPHVNGPWDLSHLTIGYTFGIAFMFHRDLWDKVGPYHKTPYGDFEWAVRAAEAGMRPYHFEQYLAINRVHSAQMGKHEIDMTDHQRIRERAAGIIEERQGWRIPPIEERVLP